MRKLILPLILVLPTLALAENIREYKWEDHKPVFGMVSASAMFSQPSVVSLAGTTEVPLYDCGNAHCIKAMVDGEELVLEIANGNSYVSLSEAAAGKFKKRNLRGAGPQQVASADFSIGDASFDGVKVFADYTGPFDGSIGFATFPNLSVAVLPSKGVLKLAPAGTDFSGEVGGTTVAYIRVDDTLVKDGGKVLVQPQPLVLQGTMGGVAVGVLLHSASSQSRVGAHVAPKGGYAKGATVRHRLSLELGDTQVTTTAIQDVDKSENHVEYDVRLSAQVTALWDYAWDPSTGSFAFAELSSVTRLTLDEERLEEALAGLEAPEVDDDEEAPPPLEGPALAAAHIAVSNAYSALARWDKALEHANLAAEADAESCSVQLDLGWALVDNGRTQEARGAFARSAELYDAWAELPLPERDAYNESKEEDPELYDGPRSQSHSCNDAWPAVARMDLAAGRYEDVIATYEGHFDLNADLAASAGLAYLELDRVAEAEAAWRQFIRLDPQSAEGFAALGLLNEHKGKTTEARQAYKMAEDGIGYGRVAPESTDLKELAQVEPSAWLDYAIQLHISGQDPTEAGKEAVAALEREALLDDAPSLRGSLAIALVLAGRADEGKALGQEVLDEYPRNAYANLALAWASEGAEAEKYLMAAKAGSDTATVWSL